MRTAAFLLLLVASPALALWPQPTSISNGTTPLRLAPGFSISLAGVHNAPADLSAAAQRTLTQLQSDKLARLVVGRGASDAPVAAKAKQLTSLKVSLSGVTQSVATEAVKPLGTRDESYTLSVPAAGGAATLSAKTTLGLFRGLATFSQLWYTVDGTVYTLSAPFEIEDAPAFVRARYITLGRECCDADRLLL
jgi:hexosaminidase